ncbi:WD40-repeat-containing domain protein [Crepidotus variabilis]|uniref:DNA damage-binding protein CMR1 n=1 Tax=Crepidotus variabilis TaxID=179855 RepID=A0A9P6EUX4_9AGAR|nr:WD40-repeat-containing domain protein [Crepidotus variabilis]
MPAKSQYELDREANIAKNRALFEDLGLKQTLESLGTSSAKPIKPAAKPVPEKRLKRERVDEPTAPRRASRRLQKKQGGDFEETEEEKKLREEEEVKEEEARKEAEEKSRLAKRPRHDTLNFNTLAESNSPEDLSSLSTIMKNVVQCSRRVADSEAFVYKEDAEKQEKREVQGIREKVQNLKVVSRAKVVQDRIYCSAYHPELTKDLLFFGDKAGMLGIWDARAPQDENEVDGDITPQSREGGKYWRLQVHWPATSKSSISCVKVDPIDSHNVYTSAYDCSVRSVSFVSGVSNELYSNDDKILLTSFDLPPSGQEMWISDTAGGVTHLDLRETKSKARRYGLSDNKIGTVSVNPTRNHFLVTASNSRVVKIWDARKLDAMPISLLDDAAQVEATEEVDNSTPRRSVLDFDSDVVNQYNETSKGKGTMRAEFQHGKSASSAYWDARGRQIVSTSYDDRIRLWDISSPTFKIDGEFPNLKPFSQIRHNCQTGRWLTILRAQWSTNPDVFPYFSVGNMNHSLDLYSCKGELITQLTDPTMVSAVQAVTCTHPSLVERAASGNASGRVNLWAPEGLKDEQE